MMFSFEILDSQQVVGLVRGHRVWRREGGPTVDFPGKASVASIPIHCETLPLPELEDSCIVTTKPILCLWHHMVGAPWPHPYCPILGFRDKGRVLTRSEHSVLAAT